MLDKIPFDFIRHKSKTALKRNHSKILVASRYTFQKQPCIIKHNCLFHTVFIKPFVTFLVETAFIIFNCKLSIFFATLSVIIVTQHLSFNLICQTHKNDSASRTYWCWRIWSDLHNESLFHSHSKSPHGWLLRPNCKYLWKR